MPRKKIWIANVKQHLFALLPNECLFTDWKAIKERIQTTKGSSLASLTPQAEHFVLSEDFSITVPYAKLLYIDNPFTLTSPAKRRQRLEAFGLHTYSKLPHERLFLFRMLHLNALVWTRVNEKLQPIDSPNLIVRSENDMIVHHEYQLSEIVLRQAETVAARALYAFQIDAGSVLLAISGSGTIAVREIYPLQKLAVDFDKEVIKQAMKSWSMNSYKPAKLLNASHEISSAPSYESSAKRKSFMKPFINEKVKVSPFKDLNKSQNKLEDKALSLAVSKEQADIYAEEVNTLSTELGELLGQPYDEAQSSSHSFPEVMLMGADPELLFTDAKGNVVPAIEVLNDDPLGRYGIDSIIVDQRLAFPVAELRPDPQETPQELLYEMVQILQEMYEVTMRKELIWKAGSMPTGDIALGGHLHFSGVKLTSRLLRMLDYYVALPLSLIEDTNGKQRRPRYGGLGDFRRQEYGGFEYRTLPSWLVSPVATKAALALSYLVVKEQAFFDSNMMSERNWIEAFLNGDEQQLLLYCEAAFHEIAACPGYEKYKSWIEPLQQMIAKRQRWNEQRDIRLAWRLLPQEVH